MDFLPAASPGTARASTLTTCFHFPFSTFNFPFSTFNFPFSTFHFQLYKASPLRWRFKEVEAKLRIIFGIRNIFNHKSDKNARKSVHKSRLKMKRPSVLTPLQWKGFYFEFKIRMLLLRISNHVFSRVRNRFITCEKKGSDV